MTSIDDLFCEDSKSQENSDLKIERDSGRCKYAERRAIEMQESYVASGFLGIIIAAGLYPCVVSVFCVLYAIPNIGLAEALLVIGVSALVGGAVGTVVALFTGVVAIPLVNAVNRSLGYPLDPQSSAICAGSLAGYIPTSWVLFTPELMGTNLWDFITVALIGPALAMVFGAVGAAWSCAKYGALELEKLILYRKYRLSISHLMIGTAWIAIVFAIANYFGGLGFVIAAAYWLGFQALMLAVIFLWQRNRQKKCLFDPKGV